MENWKDIPGCEGLYQASDLGRIKSIGRIVWSKRRGKDWSVKKPGKILFISVKRRYPKVTIVLNDGIRRDITVHKLVATAFFGPVPNGKNINHIDGDTRNNRADNLEYTTPSENQLHAYKLGLQTPNYGEKCGTSRLKMDDILIIRSKYKKHVYTLSMIAREYGISFQHVSEIINKKVWAHV